MRHFPRRCTHCQDVYSYQASGYGCDDPNNDGRYCPDCMGKVRAALADVPLKRKQVWKVTDEVTFEMAKAWEQEYLDEPAKGFLGLKPRRVFPGLTDLEAGASQHIYGVAGRGDFKGRHFRYIKWSDDREPAKVEEQFELTIATGKTQPWKEYTRS